MKSLLTLISRLSSPQMANYPYELTIPIMIIMIVRVMMHLMARKVAINIARVHLMHCHPMVFDSKVSCNSLIPYKIEIIMHDLVKTMWM